MIIIFTHKGSLLVYLMWAVWRYSKNSIRFFGKIIKIKNIRFFEKFERNLKNNGFIINDNISFHGLTEKDESEIASRNVRGLVRKIKAYIDFLKANDEYAVSFLNIGDGLAIAEKK